MQHTPLLVDKYFCLSQTSVVAFVDLQSAFDVANREVILDQFFEFDMKGTLKWIRGYLSNSTSRMLFSSVYSPSLSFHLGRSQGGVFSSIFLYSFALVADIPGTTSMCYADHISVHSTTPMDLQ